MLHEVTGHHCRWSTKQVGIPLQPASSLVNTRPPPTQQHSPNPSHHALSSARGHGLRPDAPVDDSNFSPARPCFVKRPRRTSPLGTAHLN
ncbi:hypothetical protein BC567DRAFT_227890 [Phyllosticta citribraziliensis]